MEETYQRHKITIITQEVNPGQWDLQIEVTWIEKGKGKNKQFTVSRCFKSSGEAEIYGLTWAKKWIDNKKPGTPLTIH